VYVNVIFIYNINDLFNVIFIFMMLNKIMKVIVFEEFMLLNEFLIVVIVFILEGMCLLRMLFIFFIEFCLVILDYEFHFLMCVKHFCYYFMNIKFSDVIINNIFMHFLNYQSLILKIS
jgi:hypothetical protein